MPQRVILPCSHPTVCSSRPTRSYQNLFKLWRSHTIRAEKCNNCKRNDPFPPWYEQEKQVLYLFWREDAEYLWKNFYSYKLTRAEINRHRRACPTSGPHSAKIFKKPSAAWSARRYSGTGRVKQTRQDRRRRGPRPAGRKRRGRPERWRNRGHRPWAPHSN